MMTKESEEKLFIYTIDKKNFFEVSNTLQLVKRLDKLKHLLLSANDFIIGYDTQVNKGYVSLIGLNPRLLKFNFTELTNTDVGTNTSTDTRGKLC
tara:strand:- start:23 stop:307 length:285 start_codon:yes stop_codon:yes gene_type:complete